MRRLSSIKPCGKSVGLNRGFVRGVQLWGSAAGFFQGVQPWGLDVRFSCVVHRRGLSVRFMGFNRGVRYVDSVVP